MVENQLFQKRVLHFNIFQSGHRINDSVRQKTAVLLIGDITMQYDREHSFTMWNVCGNHLSLSLYNMQSTSKTETKLHVCVHTLSCRRGVYGCYCEHFKIDKCNDE